MADSSHEDKSLLEDEDTVKGLVDYGFTSEDEDPAPLLKKKRLNDSGPDASLSGNGSSNSDSVEEEEGEIGRLYSDIDSDGYDMISTDMDLLKWGPYSYRRADRLNREVFLVNLNKDPREESKCLELLDAIGCQDRFLGCSFEKPLGFYANLSEEEAAKMEGLDGIGYVQHLYDVLFEIQ